MVYKARHCKQMPSRLKERNHYTTLYSLFVLIRKYTTLLFYVYSVYCWYQNQVRGISIKIKDTVTRINECVPWMHNFGMTVYIIFI
jgi:hypothetical protein